MAGKMPKLNCTLTSTTTAKTADTKWLIQYEKAGNCCDISKQKLVCGNTFIKGTVSRYCACTKL